MHTHNERYTGIFMNVPKEINKKISLYARLGLNVHSGEPTKTNTRYFADSLLFSC